MTTPMTKAEVLFWAFNPITWALLYATYRILFTEPGRPPLHEDEA